MNIDENDFFRGATLRICGSLEIEQALHQLLLYIRRFMPADGMAFHVHGEDLSVMETVAHATLEGAEALTAQTPLPPDLVNEILEAHSKPYWVVDSWKDDAIGKLALATLGLPRGSGVALCLMVGDKLVGALDVSSFEENQFTPEHARLMGLLNDPLAIALENSMRYREVLELKELLTDDKRYLQDELRKTVGEEIIGADFGLKGVMELVRQVAPLKSPVLLTGETGTGKEVIAGGIHNASRRGDAP
ncbi:MAG: GAF domain-containing protein, partial [Desulfobacterales bacterium]|nr:GAF domain-containing protein [Desulfobacterales bacterium]